MTQPSEAETIQTTGSFPGSDWEAASFSLTSKPAKTARPLRRVEESGAAASGQDKSEEAEAPIEEAPAASGQEQAASGQEEEEAQFEPTQEMIDCVMGPDSEEVRAGNMKRLHDLVTSLGDLNAHLKAVMPSPAVTPRGSPAGSRAPSSEKEQGVDATAENVDVNDMPPDYGDQEEEEEWEPVAPADMEAASGQVTGEEVQRLVDLLGEQQEFLQKLLDETAQQKQEADHQCKLQNLLQHVTQNDTAESLRLIQCLRPADLRNIKDLAGMTVLHWASRTLNYEVVLAILERAPELANVPTSLHRMPLHWTPLMILADMAPAQVDLRVATALAASMTVEGFNVRSGTYATVSHLAAARANIQLLKKILWRLYELGGRNAVVTHLCMQNQMAGPSVDPRFKRGGSCRHKIGYRL